MVWARLVIEMECFDKAPSPKHPERVAFDRSITLKSQRDAARYVLAEALHSNLFDVADLQFVIDGAKE